MPATKTYMRSDYCVGRELIYGGFRASSAIRLVHLLLLAIGTFVVLLRGFLRRHLIPHR